MQIQEFRARRYRSVYDLHLTVADVNVVVGPNGCGKSNLFSAFQLLQESLLGRLGERLVQEGGFDSVLWAGPRRDKRVELTLELKADPFEYRIVLGKRPASENPLFDDPQIKEETLRVAGRVMIDRGSNMARLRDMEGKFHEERFIDSISIFGQSTDPERFPYIEVLRRTVNSWTLYHEFRTDRESPLRQHSVPTYPTRFRSDGSNLPACLFLINQRGEWEEMTSLLGQALPESKLVSLPDRVAMIHEGLLRPTRASELSDGTLKLLCLACACYFVHPPPLMVFNEPEASLSPQAVPVLAKMLEHASQYSQLWVTTHSMELANALRDTVGAKIIPLEKDDGETCIVGGSRRGRFIAEPDP